MCAPHPRSPPEEPTGGTSFRGVCKAGHIFIYEWAATPQSSGRRTFVLFSPPAQRQPSAKQSAKGHLILSPPCPFLGPGREALTGTHFIAASTSNSQITALHRALIAFGMQPYCDALPQIRTGFISKNEDKQPLFNTHRDMLFTPHTLKTHSLSYSPSSCTGVQAQNTCLACSPLDRRTEKTPAP